jgi:hypothetical protein
MDVIKRKHLPTNLPLGTTAWSWLLLDRFEAGGIVWGVWGTMVALLWLASLLAIRDEDHRVPLWSDEA